MSEEQLKRSVKGNIKLKTYNSTHITQLGTCVVHIKLKKCKEKMHILCSFRKWTGISRDARHGSAQYNEFKHWFNTGSNTGEQNRGQETHTSIENCTNKSAPRHKGRKSNNTGVISKQDTNGQNDPSNPNMSINYFYSSNNVDADKRSSSAMMQSIHTRFGNILMA